MLADALPHPDRGRQPDRPAAAEQRRADRDRGVGGSAGRNPVAAHQLATTRRSHCRPRRPSPLALRTQQIIAHETGVANTVDPLGGSYYVEALTDEMERRAYEYFAKIDELGGMVDAIKSNYPQREIADAAFTLQQGVRRGPSGSSSESTGLSPSRRRRSRRCASTRTSSASRSAACRRPARGATPPPSSRRSRGCARPARRREPDGPAIDCARVLASEGEIIEALQQVFGDYTETPVF